MLARASEAKNTGLREMIVIAARAIFVVIVVIVVILVMFGFVCFMVFVFVIVLPPLSGSIDTEYTLNWPCKIAT